MFFILFFYYMYVNNTSYRKGVVCCHPGRGGVRTILYVVCIRYYLQSTGNVTQPENIVSTNTDSGTVTVKTKRNTTAPGGLVPRVST